MTNPLKVAALGALGALAAGCGGPDNGGPPITYPADAGTNVVDLVAIDTFQGAQGDEDLPEGKLDQNIGARAYVLRDGEDAPRLVEYGTGQDGRYTLHLPDAPLLYAAYRDAVVVGASGTIDVGDDFIGRAHVSYADPGTTLHVSGDGLSPWESLDWIVAEAFNSFGFAYGFTGVPEVGGTALDGLELDWSYEGLVSRSKGDELFVLQQRFSRLADGSDLAHFPSVLRVSDLVQGSGDTTVQGSFAAAAPQALHLDARFAGFADALGDAHLARVAGHVDIAPRPFGKGDLGDLFETSARLYRADAADAVFDLSYENPFPAEWPELVSVSARGSRSFLLEGTTTPLDVYIDVGVTVARADAEAGALAPVVGPPRNVQLDGHPIGEDLDGVADAAVISWDPPALGTADGYRVEIRALQAYDAYTFDEPVATYYSKATSFHLLPGTLGPGKTYYLKVLALRGEGVDVLHAPRKLPPVIAWGGVLSGAIRR